MVLIYGSESGKLKISLGILVIKCNFENFTYYFRVVARMDVTAKFNHSLNRYR